ncbi:MAG: hypothetical protein PUC29_05595 [Clostridia bacterium]|nr:hypothetical protein [Clostridia bacterium]
MKKTAVLLLVLLLILSSCAGKNNSDGQTGDTSVFDYQFTEADGELYESVPTGSCKGYVFRILNARTSSPASNMDAEEYTGDVIDDEIFARNLRVEQRINTVIEQERDTPKNVYDKTVNSVLSGDGAYSAVFTTLDYMSALALEGYLLSADRLRGVDTDKPWWNTEASLEVSLLGEVYMLFGDIQLSFYDAHSMVGFNMNIVSDVEGLENPYDLVDSGQWTLDKMLSMAKAVSADLDGNGIRTYEDRYGCASDGSEILPLLEGCGKKLTAEDDTGLPRVTCAGDESFYDTFMKISEAMYSYTSLPYVYDTVRNSADSLSPAAVFKGGNVLFFVTDIGHLYSLRDMEYEFGVLPLPKESASQKDYISYISAESVTALGVPAVLRESAFAFEVIENLAAESYRIDGTKNNYLDRVLQFRYVNDDRSRKNLREIISSGVLDIGEVYNFGGVSDAVKSLCYDTDTYSSVMAKVERASLADIKDAIGRTKD